MKVKKMGMALALGMGCPCIAYAAPDLKSAFSEGTVSGNIRSYYNMREFDQRPDQTGLAVGGLLRAETARLGFFKMGVGYYTAQDLGLNASDPAEVDGRMGSDLEVLGEAYFNLAAGSSALTVGRQRIATPMANPSDAFIIPITYEGVSFSNKSIANVSLEASYITRVKMRNSDQFVNVGTWSTGRYGVEQEETAGTLILGARYNNAGLSISGWYYDFDDLFSTFYGHAGYTFGGSLAPFVEVQYGTQSESGDALLGEVDSTMFGVQGGLSFNRARLVVGYNNVAEEPGSVNNGAFLAPYNFSTGPMFTNNMLETMENSDAGDSFKVSLFYTFPNLDIKLSYAVFDYKNAVDRNATDFDVTYNLGGFVEGLSLRYRMEIVSADVSAAEHSDHRFQLQYVF
ncbi:OprD family outer membrane porin [Marinimicrobium sp. ABcell2]|uniref:OprD family outer membrane porin n=1 Tax=Marinimicrobium sp. ABcell2 TaxID=3069751 RepID=UPI0027B34360|nr:OprD family outer membrane porin [Marinimicrobium sp. ABcell2]MDQ2078049.1 OprD family outer membrane porin [Marinimicrobium sp. ABcell2]